MGGVAGEDREVGGTATLLAERDSLKRVLAQVVVQVLRPDGEVDFMIPRQAEGVLVEACRLSGVPWRWVDPDLQGLAMDLRLLAGNLKAEGYELTQWVSHPRGIRAARPGKISVPSDYTTSRVCMTHGNFVKNRHETHPGVSRGICILDVAPCLFCHPNAGGLIRRSRKTL